MLESCKSGAFTYQRLSEEEQKRRRILGRLVGVIADGESPTRNNRLYSRKLWEKVFNDPLMQEKIEHRCCFGELDHPTDREETDSMKIAICLAEKPKFAEDGKLYGVFDILDTPCGNVLKALCDYGCDIGISSRGSGDVMPNDEVDPDSYFCEGFDAVLIPAVKAARMQRVNESLSKRRTLTEALAKLYESAETKDKAQMKDLIDNINVKLEAAADVEAEASEDKEAEAAADVTFTAEEAKEIAAEVAEEINPSDGDEKIEEENVSLADEAVEAAVEAKLDEEGEEEAKEEDEVDESLVNRNAEQYVDHLTNDDHRSVNEAKEEDSEEEAEDKAEDEEAKPEEEEANTVKDLVDGLKEYDPDLTLEFKPVVIDDKEYEVVGLDYDESEDGKLSIVINCELPADEESAGEIDAASGETSDSSSEGSEEADDDGMDDLMDSLKEMIARTGKLEEENNSLKAKLNVGDAEANKLREEIERYRDAFARTSTIASTANKFKTQADSLKEQLAKANSDIKALRENQKASLNEGIEQSNQKIRSLQEQLRVANEQLKIAQARVTDDSKALAEKLEVSEKKSAASAKLAESYKTKLAAVLNGYIESKASMLGVSKTTITSRLSESYSLRDIDKICDDILDESFGMHKSSLPIGASTRVKMVSNRQQPKPSGYYDDPDNGYQIDEEFAAWVDED